MMKKYGKIIIIITMFFLILIFPHFQSQKITINNQHNEKFIPSNNNYQQSKINYNFSKKIQNILNEITENELQYNLNYITTHFPSRVTGSLNCSKACEWIFEKFKNMNNTNVKKINWTGRGDIYRLFRAFSGVNIECEKEGVNYNNSIYILSAQYDGSINSPAALDNGAGIAALLTIANSFSEYSFNHTIRFLLFSGEEQGAVGSYNYAKNSYEQNENLRLVLNADVIANNTYHTNRSNLLRCYSTYPSLWIISAFNEVNSIYNINIDVESREYRGNSDDKAFDDYGYPAMQLFQSSNQMESFYGAENDTISLINFSYLTNITKSLAATFATVADMPKSHNTISITSPKEDTIYLKNNKQFNILNKGWIISNDILNIKTEIDESEEIDYVIFDLINGRNEDEAYIERDIINSYSDYSYPYEWTISAPNFGWFMVRATAIIDETICDCDELEFFSINPGF